MIERPRRWSSTATFDRDGPRLYAKNQPQQVEGDACWNFPSTIGLKPPLWLVCDTATVRKKTCPDPHENAFAFLRQIPDEIAMERAWRCLCAVVLLCGWQLPAAERFEFAGPAELQDTFLPSQLRYQSYPESARVLHPGEWQGNLTVDWAADLAKTDTYLFDGETITTTLKVRHSPIPNWEFGFDLPYADRIDGTLDEFIEFVETTLNQRVESRYTLPRDTYQAFVATDHPLLLLKKGRGFKDMTVRTKYQLLRSEEHSIDAALVGTLAIPTGEGDFGGEGFTPGFGVHLQKPFRHFNLFAGAAATYNSDAIVQDFRLYHWRGMGYTGVEFRPWKYISSVFEYQTYSAIAPHQDPLNEPSQYWSWSVIRLYIDPVIFEAGFVENSLFGLWENRNSSDVVFRFSLTAHF